MADVIGTDVLFAVWERFPLPDRVQIAITLEASYLHGRKILPTW